MDGVEERGGKRGEEPGDVEEDEDIVLKEYHSEDEGKPERE